MFMVDKFLQTHAVIDIFCSEDETRILLSIQSGSFSAQPSPAMHSAELHYLSPHHPTNRGKSQPIYALLPRASLQDARIPKDFELRNWLRTSFQSSL